MTPELPRPALIDVHNYLLTPAAGEITVGQFTNLPGGNMLGLTIRTSSATVTVALSKQEALNWAAAIRAEAEKLGTGLIVASGILPPAL